MAAIQTPFQVAVLNQDTQELVGGFFIKTALGIDGFLRYKWAGSGELSRHRADGHRVIRPTRRLTKRSVGLHVLSGQLNRAVRHLTGTHPLPGITNWRDLVDLNHREQAAADPVPRPNLEDTVDQVEHLISYRFRNKNLLVEALRPDNTQRRYWEATNDRLEYLGDAVLETCAPLFWVAHHIDLGSLREYTAESVCNLALQAVMLEVGLDAHLIGATEDQLADIATAREQHELAILNSPDDAFWKGVHLSKTLADAMEAIFGAVFLDSDMSFPEVCDLFERLHWPVVGCRLSAPPEP
ncbi:MAG: ribonuclease III domain-containing protein [Benniella sp.]|nr:MAG: ribonuclease III domain-containing protein [Benniella sp.]